MNKLSFGTWIVLAMGAFMLLMVYFFYLAQTDTTTLITADAWGEGNAYQGQLDAQNRTRHYGTVEILQAAPGQVQLRLPGDSTQREPLQGEARLLRPNNPGADIRIPLGPTLLQTLRDPRLTPGKWRLRLRWQQQGVSYYDEALVTF